MEYGPATPRGVIERVGCVGYTLRPPLPGDCGLTVVAPPLPEGRGEIVRPGVIVVAVGRGATDPEPPIDV